MLLWHALQTRGAVKLSGTMDFPLQSRPLVSILIPARNEAEVLTATLPRFLSQDYGNFEVILVDDASTDATAEVAGRLASSCPERFRLLRVDTLPPDWIGKTHALDTAFRAAKGEWVLAADADILLHPKALRAGLWVAERQGADLVSIFAFMECVSFWEKVILPGFSLILATFFPLRKVNDPDSTVALASGGYILMRRRVWENLGGYKTVRAEMIDDLHTARIVKHSGRRIFVALTRDLVRTRMYRNFGEVWEGLRKNAFAGHHFSIRRMLSWGGGSLPGKLAPVAGSFLFCSVVAGQCRRNRGAGVANPGCFCALRRPVFFVRVAASALAGLLWHQSGLCVAGPDRRHIVCLYFFGLHDPNLDGAGSFLEVAAIRQATAEAGGLNRWEVRSAAGLAEQSRRTMPDCYCGFVAAGAW